MELFLRGHFFGGRLNGKGTKRDINGKIFDGQFDSGQIIKGTVTCPDGTVFEGEFAHKEFGHPWNGELSYGGKGTMKDANGMIQYGTFRKDNSGTNIEVFDGYYMKIDPAPSDDEGG